MFTDSKSEEVNKLCGNGIREANKLEVWFISAEINVGWNEYMRLSDYVMESFSFSTLQICSSFMQFLINRLHIFH